MPRPTSKTIARRLNGVALPALALPMIALACMAVPARAQTVEGSGGNRVMMFERPPTVEELREAVKPGPAAAPATDGSEQPKIRTRSIEIIGGGMNSANRPRPTDSVNYGAPAQQQATSQQSYSPPTAPVAQPEPAPQPKPKRAPVQEAAAPPVAPPPAAPRRSNGVQPATLSAPETPAETRPTNGFGFRINFAFNSADVPKEFYSYVDAVGGLMSQDPQLRLVIEGHTDARGKRAIQHRPLRAPGRVGGRVSGARPPHRAAAHCHCRPGQEPAADSRPDRQPQPARRVPAHPVTEREGGRAPWSENSFSWWRSRRSPSSGAPPTRRWSARGAATRGCSPAASTSGFPRAACASSAGRTARRSSTRAI
ncbi:exported protein of unknown function [Azospirillum baldaniorum]|uniref:OmpA-like domain-containing protein n=1 Tax=Azospirillum baldaniorum TaxID=1064539 RepID=A0A9P1JRE5_9PROT|nr:exported protein of unknown function [Azospirillum baldaniorum]